MRRFVKRTIDVMIATVALLLLLPLLVVLAAWVWRDGSGSILYVETRVGRGGRPFRIHKFRTLRADSPTEPTVAVDGDPRITRPGNLLRRWRLDELPQLGDVLAGAMSLVGPRPQTAANLAALDAASRQRVLTVRPGLTSRTALAHLGEDDVLADYGDPTHCYRTILVPAKVRMELADLECWSLWRDACVLLQTPFAVLSRRARRRSEQRVRDLLRHAGAVR